MKVESIMAQFSKIDHELAVSAVNHFLGKLLQIATVQEASLALHPHPNSMTIYPDLNRRLHVFLLRIQDWHGHCQTGPESGEIAPEPETVAKERRPLPEKAFQRHK